MKEASPKTIYLKDYQVPAYLVRSVDLHFELNAQQTLVKASMHIECNPASSASNQALILHGEDLQLNSISIDQQLLNSSDYQLTDEGLEINAVPQRGFTLTTEVVIKPDTNTQYQGLYLSRGMLCTQCEAQGFRRITYFLDQPDVMARYTTTLVANKSDYPVLLSNGNPVEHGDYADGRHWVKWEDPFPKPSYLFAVVAGQLACLEDHFVTASGREVLLQIYVEAKDLDKCQHAMNSLKASMRWDEQCYGREYDLDRYMIVAVSHFNMGAMENKGLNIFNTQFILARPDTATDTDYEHIEGVIGHEYFHNWTGNRITCRDWFQLSLKEGLTVFRDQEFSADQGSRAVTRIGDVNTLRTRQFAEDAGPLAHPVRPDSYIEINNFYTATVYEKGAEVVRMIHTLCGAAGFRQGTDLYFERHDGQAVTTDDFVRCMEDANGLDLTQFRNWYSQAGTPLLALQTEYDAEQQALLLHVQQSCAPSPGQAEKKPYLIPLRMALLNPDGQAIALYSEQAGCNGESEYILQLTEQQQTIRFEQVSQQPVLSALRGFSAPVRLQQNLSSADYAFLARHDGDTFNRWSALQELSGKVILELQADPSQPVPVLLVETYQQIITQDWDDLAYLALLLTLPTEQYLLAQMQVSDPLGVFHARQKARAALAESLQDVLLSRYQIAVEQESNAINNQAAAQRQLKNVCLGYLSALETEQSYQLSSTQFANAQNMTDELAALAAVVHSQHPQRQQALSAFYQKWQSEALVLDKWFALQAKSPLEDALEAVVALTKHHDFDLNTPNRVRSLVGMFAINNPQHFHRADGAGYQFLFEQIQQLDAINPQIASRLVTPLTQWQSHTPERQQQMKSALQGLLENHSISPDLFEVVSKSM